MNYKHPLKISEKENQLLKAYSAHRKTFLTATSHEGPGFILCHHTGSHLELSKTIILGLQAGWRGVINRLERGGLLNSVVTSSIEVKNLSKNVLEDSKHKLMFF